MSSRAKWYVAGVIAGGAAVLAASPQRWTSPDLGAYGLYLALALAASLVKLRLPGMEGAYSLNFFFILYGVTRFGLPETLLAGVGAALVATLLNTRKRPTAVQTLFNVGNLSLSIAACSALLWNLQAGGLPATHPASLLAVAFLYFTLNTVLVSGVLSLLQGTPLLKVWQEWYVWSFPYYLVGIGVLAALVRPEGFAAQMSWQIVLPSLYLVHFFYGLATRRPQTAARDETENENRRLPAPARAYIGLVTATGLGLATWAGMYWESADVVRFLAILGCAVLTSMWKVRLPRMVGTISVNFVVLLAAVAALSMPEVIFIATVAAIVQSLWKPKQRPMPIQVAFNAAALVTSAVLAQMVFLWFQTPALENQLTVLLVATTCALYFSNTLLVSVALCLVNGAPLNRVFENCCFWSFPYYMVGAAFAGLMVATQAAASWQLSLLVLPLMGLVYASYRLHVGRSQA